MLTITSIKASKKKPNQVWLTFSDSSFIPFFIDDVIKLSLAKNQEIDELKFNSILNASLFFLGNEYSLRQIAISPKVEKIIRQKLKLFFRKNIQKYKIKTDCSSLEEITNKIVENLRAKKLLNEKDFVIFFANRNKNKPRQQIIYQLKQFNINPQYFSLITNDSVQEIDKIKKILQKKGTSIEKLLDFNEKNKIKANLFRRAFKLSDINTAIDDLLNSR